LGSQKTRNLIGAGSGEVAAQAGSSMLKTLPRLCSTPRTLRLSLQERKEGAEYGAEAGDVAEAVDAAAPPK